MCRITTLSADCQQGNFETFSGAVQSIANDLVGQKAFPKSRGDGRPTGALRYEGPKGCVRKQCFALAGKCFALAGNHVRIDRLASVVRIHWLEAYDDRTRRPSGIVLRLDVGAVLTSTSRFQASYLSVRPAVESKIGSIVMLPAAS
jgi:hypothetical protein